MEHYLRVSEERMALEVWMRDVDEREVVELSGGHRRLEDARSDALQVPQVRDAWVGSLQPRRVEVMQLDLTEAAARAGLGRGSGTGLARRV